MSFWDKHKKRSHSCCIFQMNKTWTYTLQYTLDESVSIQHTVPYHHSHYFCSKMWNTSLFSTTGDIFPKKVRPNKEQILLNFSVFGWKNFQYARFVGFLIGYCISRCLRSNVNYCMPLIKGRQMTLSFLCAKVKN